MKAIDKAYIEFHSQGCFAVDTCLELANENIDPDALLEHFLTHGGL